MMYPTPKNQTSKHNGVLPQPNASGAQIYAYHHRFWPRTFHPQEPYDRASSISDATLNYSNQENNPHQDQPQDQSIDKRQIIDAHENSDEEEEEEEEREHMFEKPLTPSDVGKLNRLVIPKQHAEKYFPLGGDSADKGLILSFDDESGKSWKFRYSYWNSSQSYVLTKGWSRFVKEKRLDAGDIVWFERHRLDADRTFIRWRRRASSVQDSGVAQAAEVPTGPWARVFYSAHPYPSHPRGPQYQSDYLHAAEPVAQNQTTPGNCKRLRLFGVNLDCQLDGSEPPRPDSSYLSNQGGAHLVYDKNMGWFTYEQGEMDEIVLDNGVPRRGIFMRGDDLLVKERFQVLS